MPLYTGPFPLKKKKSKNLSFTYLVSFPNAAELENLVLDFFDLNAVTLNFGLEVSFYSKKSFYFRETIARSVKLPVLFI